MGTTNYDVIVIGLGPAGIMATLTLSQKGYRVLAIDRGKTYQMRDPQIPYDVANGFGGAGLFSDGKLSFFPAASNLWANLDKTEVKKAYLMLEEELKKIGYLIPQWKNNWTVRRRENKISKKVKRYRTQYFDRRTCDRFIQHVYDQLSDKILLEREVILVNKNAEGVYQVFLDTPTDIPLTSKAVILATGKVGNGIMDLFENVSFKTHVRYEGGVRVETDCHNFKPYDLKQIDYKYIETFPDKVEFRTFCCCKDGQVLESDYLNNVSFNGSITPHSTGRSNIGLTVRVEDESNPIAIEIKECFNRQEEFVFDYNEKYDHNREFLIGNTFDDIMFDRLKLIIKSKAARYKTKIYGPEIEYFGSYPEFMWESFRISNEKTWVAGDLSAKFRGIIAALISGIYAANNVDVSIGDTI